MSQRLFVLIGTLFALAPCVPAQAQAGGSAANTTDNKAAQEAIAAKATTTTTYRGQRFLMKRTPDNLLAGDATDCIAKLETQLSFCYTVLLADTLNPTCPPEREASIRAALKYLGLARPGWDQKAYTQEFRFYLAEDKRRRKAID